MKIEQLRFLISVVKYGSINAASKKEFVTQQSLNKSLTALESELGVTLLNRTKMGTRLTEKGEIVFREAQAIVSQCDRMLERLGKESTTKEIMDGKLNIHIASMLDVAIMPLAYMEFIQTYPNVQIYSAERSQKDILQAVLKHPGDLGLFLSTGDLNDYAKDEHLELYPLKRYPILMAMSPKHPLAQHNNLALQTITDYPLVIYEAGGQSRHPLSHLTDMKVALASRNERMCEYLLNEEEAIMCSFAPFVERNVFKDFVHIPISHKNAYYELYMVIHREASNHQRMLANKFSQIFREYL